MWNCQSRLQTLTWRLPLARFHANSLEAVLGHLCLLKASAGSGRAAECMGRDPHVVFCPSCHGTHVCAGGGDCFPRQAYHGTAPAGSRVRCPAHRCSSSSSSLASAHPGTAGITPRRNRRSPARCGSGARAACCVAAASARSAAANPGSGSVRAAPAACGEGV
ncbi:hypothetical protein DV515_00013635, partial [Chloebia gouldiae]